MTSALHLGDAALSVREDGSDGGHYCFGNGVAVDISGCSGGAGGKLGRTRVG